MKTLDDVINEMKSEMPYALPDRLFPYIKEAMTVYAKEACKEQRNKRSKY